MLSHTITGLTIGLNYKFTLQAINPVGQSVLSEPLNLLAALKPLPPQDLNVTGSMDGSIELEWRAPADMRGSHLLGYKVYY